MHQNNRHCLLLPYQAYPHHFLRQSLIRYLICCVASLTATMPLLYSSNSLKCAESRSYILGAVKQVSLQDFEPEEANIWMTWLNHRLPDMGLHR